MDLNRDGVLSREEAKAAKAKLLKRREERKGEAQKRQADSKIRKQAQAEAQHSAAQAPPQAPQNP